MKVILQQDVENLGKKNDIVQVKPGYARNFLFPRKLAVPATLTNLKMIKKKKEEKTELEKEKLKEFQRQASKLDGIEVEIPVKMGDKGQAFGSVNKSKISKILEEMGFKVKPSQIILEEPIKELGEFPVKVSLPHNLEAEVRVIVTEE